MSETAQEPGQIREGYTEVQLGPKLEVIPCDWEIESLSNWISSLETGGRPKTSERSESDSVLSIGGTHISEGSFDLDSPVRISEAYYEGLNSGKIEEDDILLVKDGATIGKSTYVNKIPEGRAAVNSHVYILRVNHEQFDPRFLYQFIKSKTGLDQILRLTTGTAQPGLNRTFQQATKVPTPPLSEQRRIADILSTVDKQVRQTNDIIEGIKELKSGTIQDLLTRGADKRETSSIKVPMIPKEWELPTHWDLKFLEDVTELITDGTHQTPDYVVDGVPFLRVENIKGNQIDWDNVTSVSQSEYEKIVSGKVPNQGDVLLSKNGTIGRTQVVDWEQKFAYYVSLCLIRPKSSVVDSRYLSEVLSSEISLQQAKIRSKKATVTNLHLEEIRQFSIPIPPLETQKRIANIIDKINEVLSLEMRRLESVKDLKRGLMQDLLTGKVRVNPDN